MSTHIGEQVGIPPTVPIAPRGEEPATENPFRLGSRYIRTTLPDGQEEIREVPLTLRDLLYPEEGDEYVMRPAHLVDLAYLQTALEARLAGPGVVVLGDCQFDFGVPGVQELRPDVMVLFDVQKWAREGTFRIREEGGRIVVLIEVTSKDTRQYDLNEKKALYYQASVGSYVLVDRGPSGKNPPKVYGYVRGPRDWVDLPVSAAGRVTLPELGLELGADAGRAVLYDAVSGEALPHRAELEKKVADARQTADDLAQKLAAAAEERAALEAKIRELESRLPPQS